MRPYSAGDRGAHRLPDVVRGEIGCAPRRFVRASFPGAKSLLPTRPRWEAVDPSRAMTAATMPAYAGHGEKLSIFQGLGAHALTAGKMPNAKGVGGWLGSRSRRHAEFGVDQDHHRSSARSGGSRSGACAGRSKSAPPTGANCEPMVAARLRVGTGQGVPCRKISCASSSIVRLRHGDATPRRGALVCGLSAHHPRAFLWCTEVAELSCGRPDEGGRRLTDRPLHRRTAGGGRRPTRGSGDRFCLRPPMGALISPNPHGYGRPQTRGCVVLVQPQPACGNDLGRWPPAALWGRLPHAVAHHAPAWLRDKSGFPRAASRRL